jgi:phage shock protein PspC (stress-responsive transcriptional regulator)
MTENLPPDQPEPARGDPEAETVRMSSGDPLAGGSTPPAGDQPPRPAPPPAARRFQRSRDDRLIAGVAGGLAATLGIDAALVRVGIVVLSLFGGAGVLLYLAAVLLMPEAPVGTRTPRPAGTHGDRDRTLTIIGVVVLVLVAGPLLLIPAMFAGGDPRAVAMSRCWASCVPGGDRPESRRDAGS